MIRLRTAPAAREDIREIRKYSKAVFGPAVARQYLEGLSAIFALLEERPLAGPIEGDLGIGIRSFGYRSHRIYDRVEGDGLLVLRILHHMRDVVGAFGQDQ